jgi:hypothetical protein
MFEPNPFGKEGTVNIIETRPRNVRILSNARAICIRPDPKDPKAKPRVDDIDAFIARLPPHTVELIDIHYDSLLPRLPRLDGQGNIRFAHIGARKLRDYSPLFGLTRLESLFLVSFSLPDLSAFQTRQLKYLRLIRGRLTHLDLSATAAFLQRCTNLRTFGAVSIANLILESCQRVDLASLTMVEGLRQLRLLAPGPLPSFHALRGCKSLESLVITATPLGKTDFGALGEMPSLKWVFLTVGDARVSELSKALPRVMVTNGSACFRASKSLPYEQYYRETEAAKFALRA